MYNIEKEQGPTTVQPRILTSQYLIINYKGKESGKEEKYMTESIL